MNDLTVKLQV